MSCALFNLTIPVHVPTFYQFSFFINFHRLSDIFPSSNIENTRLKSREGFPSSN